MATKKLTSRTTPITPASNNVAKLARWFATGIATTLTVGWIYTGGFTCFTDAERIVILLIIGTTYGMWAERWLNK